MVKKPHPHDPEFLDNQEDEGEGNLGGSSGEIEFRFVDPLLGPPRDDLLAPNEINRLRSVHKDTHKERVKKQRITREERAALKEGRYVSTMETKLQQSYGMGGGSQGSSKHKKHWISEKAQFSGIDKQVVGIPTLSEMETNVDNQEKLEQRYENKLRNTPKFNPRPRPPG